MSYPLITKQQFKDMPKGVRGTDKIHSGLRGYDLADVISLLDVSKYPLLAILTNAGKDPVTKEGKALKKEETTDSEFRWFEDEFGTRTLNVDSSSSVNAGADAQEINISGQSKYVQVGDVLHVPDLGWTFEVVKIETADQIKVNKDIGGATDTVDINGKEIWIIGNTNEEGAGLREIKGTSPERKIGYCQIFRTPFGVTETAKQTKTLIKENDLDYQRRKKAIEHAVDIERAFLFSKAKEITDGSQPKRYTEGIFNAVTENVSWGIDTEPEFEQWLESAFLHGNTEKYLFAAPSVLSMIIGFAKNKIQIVQSEKTYGILITKYISPHGTLNIIEHPLLTGAYGNTGVCLDMECLTYKYLTGRDTKLLTNRQNPGDDQRIDEYLTECGLQIKEIKKHAKMSMNANPSA